MGVEVFGRTNRKSSHLWLRLLQPINQESASTIADAASQHDVVIDVTYSPALFGRFVNPDREVTCDLTEEAKFASDSATAHNLTTANIIQILSAIGRPSIDYLFLPIKSGWEDFQVQGVLNAIFEATEEGLVQNFGLHAKGSGVRALSLWNLHDGFEMVQLPATSPVNQELVELAKSRRVGMLQQCDSPDQFVQLPFATRCDGYYSVPVHSPDEVEMLFPQSGSKVFEASLPTESVAIGSNL